MNRRQFCCDASRDHYIEYYTRQQKGGDLPAFVGARYQRGHGIGSILAGLFRRVLPYLRANAKNLGVGALKTGMQIADDMLQGQKFSESAKQRIPEGIKSAAQNFKWQTGEGFCRGRKRQAHAKNPAKRTRHDDIFN
jgi:hypothetical protein